MKKLIYAVLMLANTAAAFGMDLPTGSAVTINAKNTSCPSGNYPKVTAVSLSDMSAIRVQSECSPILCMVFKDMRAHHSDYAVSIQQIDGTNKLSAENLSKDEANRTAAQLVKEGLCGRTGFTSFMEQANGGNWSVVE